MSRLPVHLSSIDWGRRASAALVAAALVLAGCGGGDDDADPGSESGTEAAEGSTTAPAGPDDETGPDDADAAAAGPSQGGEVRALPGLAEYADMPLADFLAEAFGFPEAVPVLDLELARAYSSATAVSTENASLTFGVDHVAPEGGPEEVFAVVDEMIDTDVWTADGEIVETSPGYHSRTWTSTDEEVTDVTIVFQEDAGEVVLTATSAIGVTAEPPPALWPWAGDVAAPPGSSPVSWTVQIPDTGGGPALYLDMRWRGATGSYDALAAFAAAPLDGPLTAGEVTTETDPFTSTDVAVTAEGGFEGVLSVLVTDPSSDPDVILTGTVDLAG